MAKVFWTDYRTSYKENIADKLRRLLENSDFVDIDFKKKYVAIKMHFGELGNMAFLRPNYAKVVADMVKERGGRPFLVDCNTLYPGSRKNALDHLSCAAENGFSFASTGCHVVIGDGLKGTDEIEVAVNGDYVNFAKIGRAVMDADIIISLNHFKCHESTGIGGAIKNLGMGCGSRAGKMEMHNSGKVEVDEDLCISCANCYRACGSDAISFPRKKAWIDPEKCVGCGRCIGVCPVDATAPVGDNSNDVLNAKMAEYCLAVVQGRPNYHISMLREVSPYCDCHSENDLAIIPDVGMFCSSDPVAIDTACAEIANEQTPIPGSILYENRDLAGDIFAKVHSGTNWRQCVVHAEKLGLGKTEYDLVRMENLPL